MNSARALTLAVALVAAPSVAFAQTPPPMSPWGGSLELPPPPPPDAAPSSAATPPPIFDLPDERPSRGARIGYETLGGFAGALAGGLMTVGGACILAPQQCPESSRDLSEFILLSSATNMFVIPLGVAIAGNLARGEGGFGWTFLGSVAGMSVAILPAAFLASGGGSRTSRYFTASAVLTLLPMLGSIVAYEISVPSLAHTRRFAREARVIPSFDFHTQGATAGATIIF